MITKDIKSLYIILFIKILRVSMSYTREIFFITQLYFDHPIHKFIDPYTTKTVSIP